MKIITHKDSLGENLMMMRKLFPKEYDFFPETYHLPYDMEIFTSIFDEE